MTRPCDRPATLAAFVNAVIVYLLPLALVGAIALLASDYSNGGTRVVGVDPDRAAVWSRRVQLIGAYIMGLAPFAMVAAWRTFVHARVTDAATVRSPGVTGRGVSVTRDRFHRSTPTDCRFIFDSRWKVGEHVETACVGGITDPCSRPCRRWNSGLVSKAG